jgi:uncharacterized protein YjbJ (UPF0337 family)
MADIYAGVAGIAPAIPQQGVQRAVATNMQTIQGEWTHLCDLAKQRWSQLTEDNLQVLQGDIAELVGRMQEKTGEGREAIEQFFSNLKSRGSSPQSGL